ncbi:Efflux pump, partial [Lachnellula willkommii]
MAQDSETGNEANEIRPLLTPPTEVQDGPSKSPAPSHRTRCSWPWKYVVLLCIGLAVISDIGEYLFFAPRVRLFESVVCTRFYLQNEPSLVKGDGSVPERFCKVNPVQDEVALVLGWQLFFDSIPGILLPIPYGYIAGRKWILFLALSGYTLSWVWTLVSTGVLNLPLQYVWLSSLFYLVGGGPTTGTTLLTTMVADVVPPELRSTVFFYRFCTDLIAECLVPPITSLLMSRNIWIPLIAAVIFQGLGTMTVLLLPETLPTAIPKAIPEHPGEASSMSSMATCTSETDDEPMTDETRKGWGRKIGESFEFVTRDAAVVALAGLILSLRAAVNIALYTIILPYIATLALWRTSPASKDLWIAKASILFMVLGTFILFASATPALMIIGLIVYTLGTGFAPIVRSLVTSLVESHHASKTSDIGRLYALIGVMEGIGNLVAGPGMAW